MTCVAPSVEDGLQGVRNVIAACLADTAMAPLSDELGAILSGGKMLRSRLVLHVGAATNLPYDTLLAHAAAVQMLQSASLLHDDVIDGGVLRRGEPALWVNRGMKAAILMGDFLVSRTVRLVQDTNPRFVSLLVETIQEMCESEAIQEFMLDADDQNWDSCVKIARSKTGSLFGYAAASCHERPDAPLACALREAGYKLGTAYQLADDLLDAGGNTADCGKTLGTDRMGCKLTAALFGREAGSDPHGEIIALIESARRQLEHWPSVQGAWDRFVERDVSPVIQQFTLCSSTEDAA